MACSSAALEPSCARRGRSAGSSSSCCVCPARIAQSILLAALLLLLVPDADAALGWKLLMSAAGKDGSVPAHGDTRTLRASLIHRDKFLPDWFVSSEPGDSAEKLVPWGKAHDGARRSRRRAQALARQGRNARERHFLGSREITEEESSTTSMTRSRLQSSEGPVSSPLSSEAPGSSPTPAAAGPSGDWESPLSDASDSEYIMEITLGTPARTYHAVADTGSDLTWIQCEPCGSGCFKQDDPLYDPSKSSTYEPLSCASDACNFLSDNENCNYDELASPSVACDYSYSYGDNSSTNGTLALDTISLDAYLSSSVQKFANFTFGCSHSTNTSSSLFEVTDGLVGLGRGRISFPSQLGEYFGYKFSYCLVNKLSSTVQDSPLIFGDGALSNGVSLQYTPLSGNPTTGTTTFYFVDVDNITVNGAAVPILNDALGFALDGSGGIFFDSGTTYTSLVSDAFGPLLTSVSSAISGYKQVDSSETFWELCYRSSWKSWSDDYGKGVPAISFNFLNASSYNLGVQAAYVEVETNVICVAFLRSVDGNIIGSYQQTDMLILYDLQNCVIGFTTQKCESSESSSPPPSSAHRFAPPSACSFTISVLTLLLLHLSLSVIRIDT